MVAKVKGRKPANGRRTATSKARAATSGVLTVAEAAAYLRVSEAQVLGFIDDQGLPARQAGSEWRFLKDAIDDWLRKGTRSKQGIWAWGGVFKDDPYLEEIVNEAMRSRERPSEDE